MICADLHTHTNISHGSASVKQMYAAACKTDLKYIGFSEHSPLPPGFHCQLYTGNLESGFPAYTADIVALKSRDHAGPAPLLGLELDWIPSHCHYMRSLVSGYPFDYVIGSLHYLDGYSVGSAPSYWPDSLSQEECFARYAAYFHEMGSMAQSGLVNIAAHPDFIKLRSYQTFQAWLKTPQAKDCIAFALEKMVKHNVALEINSSGLRRDFHEPYPCPAIMRIARDLTLPISFGSDAHTPEDIKAGFVELKNYAASFGYNRHVIFLSGERMEIQF